MMTMMVRLRGRPERPSMSSLLIGAAPRPIGEGKSGSSEGKATKVERESCQSRSWPPYSHHP